jgi:hypothetical protein
MHCVPNEHGGLHTFSFFFESQLSSIFDKVHSSSIHSSSSSYDGLWISRLNVICCLKQTPVFLSHTSQSDVHALSNQNFTFFIRVINKYHSHLQIGGDGYHSDGTIQKARLAPIISYP